MTPCFPKTWCDPGGVKMDTIVYNALISTLEKGGRERDLVPKKTGWQWWIVIRKIGLLKVTSFRIHQFWCESWCEITWWFHTKKGIVFCIDSQAVIPNVRIGVSLNPSSDLQWLSLSHPSSPGMTGGCQLDVWGSSTISPQNHEK